MSEALGVDASPGRLAEFSRWLPLAIVLAALLILASRKAIHLSNADAILPVLMSTQDLTWFYWGQDRLANLVPMLSSPIQDIRWNLALQFALVASGWFGLITLLSANHLHGKSRSVQPTALATVTLAVGLLSLWVLPADTVNIFLFEQLYAFALTLFILGLWAGTRPKRAAQAVGVTLLVAAIMVNPALFVHLPIVLAIPDVRAAFSRRVAFIAAATVGAFLLAMLASRYLGDQSTTGFGYNNFSLRRSWHNTDAALDGIRHSLHGWRALVLVTIAAAYLVARWRVLARRLAWTYAGALAFALAWLFAFSGNLWVATNALSPRYFFPVFAAGLLLLTGAVAELWCAIIAHTTALDRRPPRLGTHWQLASVGGMAMSAFAAVAYIERTEIDVLADSAPVVDAVVRYDVDVIAGDYWPVWPAVIEARARGHDVLAVTYRANPLADEIAVRLADELAAPNELTVLCLAIEQVSCIASVAVLSPTPLEAGRVLSQEPVVLVVEPAS
jgi:hypothetical protein